MSGFLYFILALPLLVSSIFKSNTQLKFNRMTDRFQKYTNQDISNLSNERLQHLILGGREALKEPKVINSFSILYEDIMPVRFGGDILFNMLDKAITNAKSNKGMSTNSSPTTDFNENTSKTISSKKLNSDSRKVIKDVLVYFLEQRNQSISSSLLVGGLFSDIDQNKDNSLTLEEFSDWIASVPQTIITSETIGVINNTNSKFAIIDTVTANNDILPCPKALFQEIDTDGNGLLTLEEFEAWTSLCLSHDDGAGSSSDDSSLNTNTFSPEMRLEDIPLTVEKNKRHRERYLNMVRSFANWGDQLSSNGSYESNVSSGDSRNDRMNQVIDGCFAGAKIPGVVKALGILYEEYLPLRVAGDIVFSIVESKLSPNKWE